MKFIAVLLISFCFYCSDARETPKYPVKEIPEDMLKGMYAVIRESNLTFEIYGRSKSRLYFKKVITILNEKANQYASVGVGYDKFNKVDEFKGSIYDAEGKLIKKLKSNEIKDQSSISGFSLYEDSRVKYADLSHQVYPYTIEFEYVIEKSYLYSIPEFELYEDDEISIQLSSFSIIYPKDLKPRYKLNNIEAPKISIKDDGREALEWSFHNIKPSKFEKHSPELHKVVPNIVAGPIDFEYGGYAGKMDSWENLGLWQVMLNQGRDVLPQQTKLKVKELISHAASAEEKIKILYEYLQNKTRYVSIQRGIGGFQPFEALTVDQLGYGDCKALSNYMVALLKEAGIKGYYTQVYGGEESRTVTPEFTIDYFNHIIVAVPNGKDTVWLECTSQTQPFGYLGKFTGDRYALMVTESGGKLVRTPTFSAEQNVQSTGADVHIDISGNAKAAVRTTYSGLQYENEYLSSILHFQYDEQKKWLQKNINIPSFDINSFAMKNNNARIPSAVVSLDLSLKRFATITGKRIFLTPNLMNRSTYIPEKNAERKTGIIQKMGYTDFDTIRYHLPEGIYPEFLPEPAKIKNRFGEYESSYKIEQGNLIYLRRVRMNKGEFPADSYQELIDFYKSINKADNTKMVFMSKT